MAKSTAKAKGKQPEQQQRLPSPAPSSRSASPSSSSASPSESGDDSSSSDRGSTASPEPEAPKKVQRVVDPNLRKYAPPAGFKPLKATVAQGALDWDELKNDADLELWAVRVPAGLKPKHLDGLTLTLPPSDLPTPQQPIAHFTAKKAEYDAYFSGGAASNKRKRDGADADEGAAPPGAGELAAAVPLVPRKSQGNKLFAAPRPIARTLTIQRALPAAVLANPTTAHLLKTSHSTLIASQPSPVPGAILDADALLLPPRAIAERKEAVRGAKARDQPEELLRFRLGNFGGMGAEGGKGLYHNPMSAVPLREGTAPPAAEAEGEDAEMADAEAPAGEEEQVAVKKVKKEKKEKRRKSEGGESPKKKKKEVKDEE
ncbi:hypothetical protein JCM10450v2_001982 [Rhodotorula kratochvilovae]